MVHNAHDVINIWLITVPYHPYTDCEREREREENVVEGGGGGEGWERRHMR